ncbi:hypothetical protein [Cytobacillus dafuensis]|uniref:Uncharacterized protein n=1 Tax=Cytobacillus dafuensis TaxID=1742359 RepID=A0A5B8Z629_CYTDA|nr:hypothetical protein [Cytobacillus dafuensis]QED48398.1 hypothetical protein FSZ17_14755 [Cytobacillus dafuensis]
MNEKIMPKEELINMLNEIYDQLEELEGAIESNFSNARQKWQDECAIKMRNCSEEIRSLETKTANLYDFNGKLDKKGTHHHPTGIKLELGF